MYSVVLCGPAIYRTALLEHIRLSRGNVRVSGQSNHAQDAPSLIAHLMPDAVIVISGDDAERTRCGIERIRKVDLDVRLVWWALVPRTRDFEECQSAETAIVFWETTAEEIVKAIGLPQQPLLRSDSRPRLTQQEHTVLQLAADGLSNKAIAFRLAVSESTIKNHLRHIGAKFNTSSRAQAVWQAVQWGYLQSEGKHRQRDVS